MASERLQVILELLAQQYKREAREAASATGHIGDAAAKTESAAGRMASGMSRAASVIKVALAGAAVGAIVEVVGDLDRLGQKMEATERMADTVFGNMVEDARAWADENNEAFGIGESALLSLISKTQDLLVPMGFARDAAFDMSKEILNTANALSEWTGGTIDAEDARLRIAKAILGEREGLIELGVKISEADVKTRLAEKGLDGLTGAALAQAKAQVTLELIMGRSTDALAAYEGRAGTAIDTQKDLAAATADTAETWAEILRPALDEAKDAMADIATVISRGSDKMHDLQGDSEDTARSLGEFDILQVILPGFLDLLTILDEVAEEQEIYTKSADKSGRITQEEAAAIRDQLVPALGSAIDPLDKITTAQRLAGDATKHHHEELARLGDFIAAQINPALKAHGALVDLAAAHKAAQDAEAEHGRESDEFALAQVELALATAVAEGALGTFGANAPASIDAVSQALGITNTEAQILLETLGLLDGMTVTTTIISRQVNLLEQGVIPEGQGLSRPPRSSTGAPSGTRQHGGPVTAGRPYMVGERGPELMVPHQSGSILPNGWNRPNSTIVIQSPMNDFAQDLQLATILATVNTMVEVQG